MQAMVFDLDGTAIDTMDDLVALTNQVLREFGMPEHTKPEIQSYVGNGALALMIQAVPPGTPQDVTDAALARWKELNPQFDQLSAPYPGMREALAQLRANGVRLALLSNKFDHGVQVMIDAKMPNEFEIARGERPDTPRKPDPTGLLSIFAQLDADPAQSAYVGDSPGDMQVAKNAGCLAVGVSWGYRSVQDLQDAGADVIIDRADQLLEVAGLK
ncbi:MAG: HAD family hydrolase [Coriobacteriia bacterium]|nr:HAD family hydrolase [Coriobacteriia bacterium]